MADQSQGSPLVPKLSAQACRERLMDAVASVASRHVEAPVTGSCTTLGAPRWMPVHGAWAWLAPVEVTLEADRAQVSGTLDWPVPWSSDDALPPPRVNGVPVAFPGRHAGWFVGQALATGLGVRLREGVHFIPRPSASGTLVDVVVASLLGPDVFGNPKRDATWGALSWAVLGRSPRRFSDSTLVRTMLDAVGVANAEPDQAECLQALRATWADITDDPSGEARRTAAERSRLFGPDEVLSELVFSRFLRRSRRPSGATLATQLDGVMVRLTGPRGAGAAALAQISHARGAITSVLTPTGNGTTLARVEESARASFVGFRGLGKLRGRADLRDLDPRWRGVLCPVQTPESADTGLVRFTTVGSRPDAPAALADWFDLSASAALIPFVNHDDPARASIGSKNLKQAVPVVGREPPLVATGWERVLGLASGTACAPFSGTIDEVGDETILVRSRRGVATVAYGAPWLPRSGIDNTWILDVTVGDWVHAGQILAHAPDVRVSNEEATEAELCLGVNALVALTPWHGLNFEDGIVVSASFAERMTSTHVIRIDEEKAADDPVTWLIDPQLGGPVPVELGEPLLLVTKRDGRTSTVSAPVSGELLSAFVDARRGSIAVLIRVRRRLAVGDKLTNRHQGKGVVSAILPDDQMPRLPDRTPVEVILNPVGILRRLNVGQLWEMHTGLEGMLTGDGQRVVGRTVTDPEGLAASLERLNAPLGRLPLTLPDGSLLGGADGVVVGPQYLIKLNHLASAKLGVRDGQPATAPISGQPTQQRRLRHGHWLGSAQRVGEMEIWALEAAGAKAVLADALQERSAPRAWAKGKPRASLRSVQAHLAIAGIDLTTGNGMLRNLQQLSRSEIDALTTRWRLAQEPWSPDSGEPAALSDLPELPGWRELAKLTKPATADQLFDWIATTDADPGIDDLPFTGAIGNPLYDTRVHGPIGSAEQEVVRYALPLPTAMRHPWQRKRGSLLPLLTSVPILPPAFRSPSPAGLRGIDRQYRELAIALVAYDEFNAKKATVQAAQAWGHIQRHVDSILGTWRDPARDSVLARLSGKRGLLRRFLLGQSVTFSGRSVIVPDLSIRPDQVGLPAALVSGLGVSALEPDGDVVVVNRQPSLHPYSMVALRAVTTDGDAIHLHPLCLAGLAGDFDGDTVAVHRPLSHAAREESWRLMSPAARLRSSAHGGVLASMGLDIALGLFLASTAGATSPMLADLCGGEPGVLDAQRLPEAVDGAVARHADPCFAMLTLAGLEKFGMDAATGWSIGALDLLATGRDGRLSEAIAAGVAGGERAVGQLLDRRGVVLGTHPDTPEVDVAGSFLRGLATDDYFETSPGALASLAEKKLTTPHAGAFTKTLVEIADKVVISEARCQTPDDLRSPLACAAADGICQACYGRDPATGLPPALGRRVGVLAATLIGERSTQLSMKVFHGGGQSGAVGGALGQLKAIFGEGTSTVFGTTSEGSAQGLSQFLTLQTLDDPRRRAEALQAIADEATALLGTVDTVHVQVLLRQLVDTLAEKGSGAAGLTAAAQRRGRSAFEVATARGNVSGIIPGAFPSDEPPLGGPRTRLVAGDPS